ncbi:complex I subunit 5 family protein [Spirochaeta dissipatitropha]
MIRLFPFSLQMPVGLEYSVLLLFLFLALVNGLNFKLSGRTRNIPLVVLQISGGIMAIFSADLVTLLLSWEILTVSAFLLIRQSGSVESRQASLRYITVQIFSAALFFIASLLQYQQTGSLAITVLSPLSQPFMLGAVLIKTAAMPMHFWLTESYPAAPPEVTALLSGFATKVGVLTAVRLIHLDVLGYPVLGLAGALTAVIAVLFALRQQNARKLLSFHIVSQVGYMSAAAGMSSVLVGEAAVLAGSAALFHLITHTLYKSQLILAAGAAKRYFGHENLLNMGGLVRHKPLLFFCALVGSLAIAGFPFTSGYASKELIKQGIGYGLITNLLTLASIGTALSFIKFMYLIFLRRPASAQVSASVSGPRSESESRSSESALRGDAKRMLPLLLLTAVTLLIGVLPGLVPGLPTHNFFRFSSLMNGIAPISAAVFLWIFLRKFFVSGSKGSANYSSGGNRRLSTPVSLWFARAAWPFRHLLRIMHAVDPQAQMKVMMLTLCLVLVILLFQGGLLFPEGLL